MSIEEQALQAARAGHARLSREPQQPPQRLGCVRCSAVLFRPTTLGDGRTVCAPCERKVGDRLQGEAAAGFNGAVNVLLDELSKMCMPQGHEAAKTRQAGNELFEEKRFAEAAEMYARAVTLAPSDCVPHCNRSAALLCLGDAAAAATAATAALRLSAAIHVPEHPMRVRALMRFGAAHLELARAAAERCSAGGALEELSSADGASAVCAGADGGGGGGGGDCNEGGGGGACSVGGEAPGGCRAGGGTGGTGGSRSLSSAELALVAFACAAAADPTSSKLRKQAASAGGLIEKQSSPKRVRPGVDETKECSTLFAALSRGDAIELLLCAPGEPLSPPPAPEPLPEDHGDLREKLDCAICYELLYEPAALPCGHVLCRPCVARSLDQAFDQPPSCPLCRADLSPFLGWINQRATARGRDLIGGRHGGSEIAICTQLAHFLAELLPADVAERAAQVAASEAAAEAPAGGVSIPVFVCSLAVPSVRCPLHIFEPRYRLMMRRCIDSGRREFGMVASTLLEYGTMLYIRHYEQLPDGRAILDTVGTRRFRILEWGTKDGYATARVEWLIDNEEGAQNVSLAKTLRAALEAVLAENGAREQIEAQLGAIPEIDEHLPFWCHALRYGEDVGRQYELAFGDRWRSSLEARLRAAIDVFGQVTELRVAAENEGTEDDADEIDE